MGRSGGCLCGAIRYEIPETSLMEAICHCKNCQKQAGSAFSTLAGIKKSDFKLTGEPKVYVDTDTDSGASVERFFCGACGSPIYSALPSQPNVIYLKTGTLDDTSEFKPSIHVWASTRQNWVEIDPNVPQLQKQS
ncbi:MAG: aldehyde-activating protein [Gammaproteobacteria bacterium]|nr:aldehyde-activating protein [Gammaproteobacteria bacterium]|tara:strand:+ start:706 stop:1110 length:405 start_codon:yes stop_codon:yes gene_type:complete